MVRYPLFAFRMNLNISDAKFLFYSFFIRAMTVSVHDVIYNLLIRFLK